MVGPSPTMTLLGVAVFVLQLYVKDFNDAAVCLGPQVAAVLETLMAFPELSQSVWYAAYVDAMGADEDVISAIRPYSTADEALLSDTDAFVALSRRVTQYLDGIFFAVPTGQVPQHPKEYGTDWTFETLAANAIVEVRAHDTTVIEVATDNHAIVDQAQQRFGGSVLAG